MELKYFSKFRSLGIEAKGVLTLVFLVTDTGFGSGKYEILLQKRGITLHFCDFTVNSKIQITLINLSLLPLDMQTIPSNGCLHQFFANPHF